MISRLIRASFHAPLLTALLVAAGTVDRGVLAAGAAARRVPRSVRAGLQRHRAERRRWAPRSSRRPSPFRSKTALAGLPDVRRIRSNSQLGVTQVTIEFEPDADYYRSRQFVAERVAQVAAAARRAPSRRCSRASPADSTRSSSSRSRRSRRGRSDDAARSRRVRGQEPAARGARRRGRRAARRLSARSSRCSSIPSACRRAASPSTR